MMYVMQVTSWQYFQSLQRSTTGVRMSTKQVWPQEQSVKMYNKKVNFVFDWIGPQQPIPNNMPPSVIDLAWASGVFSVNKNANELKGELQNSNCYTMLKGQQLVNTHSASHLPNGVFVYEYNHYWWESIDDLFGTFKLNGILGQGTQPSAVFDRIRNKTAYLLISIPMESLLEDRHLSKLDTYFRNSSLPMSQIIYLTCSPNGQALYDSYCERTGLVNQGLHIEYLPFYYFVYKATIANKTLEYKVGLKSKTFLMFNRRWGSQSQRSLMLCYLYKNNLIDDGYISFSKTEIDNGGTFTSHVKNFTERLTIENTITDDDLIQIESKLPLTLDSTDLTLNLMYDEFESTRHFYEDSLVHLVSETNFFTRIVHLTEKSYKPIMYKQPFIMMGACGSLKALREQGFRTFDTLWDESYDNETSDTARFFMVLELIQKICAMSPYKKLEISKACKEIVDYNYDVLKNTHTNQLVENFINKYGAWIT